MKKCQKETTDYGRNGKKVKIGLAAKLLVPILIILLFFSIVMMSSTNELVDLSKDSVVETVCFDLGLFISEGRLSDNLEDDSIYIDPLLFDYETYIDNDFTRRAFELIEGNCFFTVLEYDEKMGQYVLLEDFGQNVSSIMDLPLSKKLSSDIFNEVETKYSEYGMNIYTYECERGGRTFSWCILSQPKDQVAPGKAHRIIATGMESTSYTEAVRKGKTEYAIYIALLAVILAGITSIILAGAIKKTRRISSFINRIETEGLPDEKLIIKSHDELNEISEAINSMVEGLKEKDRMESELSVATTIQSNMLIKKFPAFPEHKEFDIFASMKPAKEVGGDLYDMFLIDDKHVAIVIGDVSDKGVPAALFMVLAKTLLKYNLQRGVEPGVALFEVNNLLNDGNTKDMFVTCFAGILEFTTGELKYASAGHNPPMIRLGDAESYEKLHVNHNLVLGLLKDVKYETEKTTLPHGSRVFLYTDGVTEAENEAGEIYEDENRFVDFINNHAKDSLTDFLNNFSDEIDKFKGDAAQFDDITMLAFDYK